MSGHVQDLLSAYLDGELSPPERAMVEAHLAACDACAARLEDFATLDTALRALPLEPPAGYFDAFPGRVRERVRGRATPAATWRVPVWGWAVAAALILAILTPLTLERARLSRAPEAPAPAAAPALSDAAARQDADEQAPAPPARERLSSAPRDAGGRGRADESVPVPRPASVPPPAAAPEPKPAAAPDERDGQLRKTGAGAAPPFAPAPVEAPGTLAQQPAADSVAGLAASPTGDVGVAYSPPAPPVSAPSTSHPAASHASREEAPPDSGAAPQVATSEAVFVQAAPTPVPRVAEAERTTGESERKHKATTESEGVGEARAAADAPGRAAGKAGLARAQDGAADDEFMALRARHSSGVATLDEARALRDDWRSFAARNPSGARGDEARYQVIEAGYRAWRLGHDARDRAVLARDAHTYLERPAGAHTERVRAILAELERD